MPSHFCYNCNRSVQLRDSDLICGVCGSDFIEEMSSAVGASGGQGAPIGIVLPNHNHHHGHANAHGPGLFLPVRAPVLNSNGVPMFPNGFPFGVPLPRNAPAATAGDTGQEQAPVQGVPRMLFQTAHGPHRHAYMVMHPIPGQGPSSSNSSNEPNPGGSSHPRSQPHLVNIVPFNVASDPSRSRPPNPWNIQSAEGSSSAQGDTSAAPSNPAQQAPTAPPANNSFMSIFNSMINNLVGTRRPAEAQSNAQDGSSAEHGPPPARRPRPPTPEPSAPQAQQQQAPRQHGVFHFQIPNTNTGGAQPAAGAQPELDIGELIGPLLNHLAPGGPQQIQIQISVNDDGQPQNPGGAIDMVITQVLNQLERAAGGAQRIITDAELARLPMTKVTQAHVDNGTQCTTCFDTFSLGEDVAELGCKHIFHRNCLLPWLRTKSSCPVCRQEVVPDGWPQPQMQEEPLD